MKHQFSHNLLFKKLIAGFFSAYSINLQALSVTDNRLNPVDSVLPMLGGLLVILLIIFGLAYLFKKFSNFNVSSQNIRVLESQPIGNKEKLMIVQVREQQFLIGVTGHTINQLGELKVEASNGTLPESKYKSSSSFVDKNKNSTFSKIISTLVKTKQQNGLTSKRVASVNTQEPIE